MKKYMTVLVCLGFLVVSCNTATPENYFDRAVLNCNMIVGFANDGFSRELEFPSVKLVEGTKDQTTAMKRKEVVNDRVRFLEESYTKIKALKETPDTKDMLSASIALYDFVLPVYKNEYRELARLYDEGASKDEIAKLTTRIHDNFFPRFDVLFSRLTSFGRVYAEQNNIEVNWQK